MALVRGDKFETYLPYCTKIEVQACIIILMKITPDFPPAQPLFCTVLLMTTSLFGPVLLCIWYTRVPL